MCNYLIQTNKEGIITEDLCLEVYNHVNLLNELNNSNIDKVLLSNSFNETFNQYYQQGHFIDDFDHYVPCGTVEFVYEYMQVWGIPIPKAINIPPDLHKSKYLNREVCFKQRKDISIKDNCFIKSRYKVKGYTNELPIYIDDIPEDEYLVSELINIDSEYRCFVHNRELLAIRHYTGRYDVFPDVNKIRHMVSDYVDCPIAYTLDVGVNSRDSSKNS